MPYHATLDTYRGEQAAEYCRLGAPDMAHTQASATQTIDHLLAQSILDRLDHRLRDLSLIYGDVVIPSGDISHELYYSSLYNDHNLLGSIWCEHGIYYVNPDCNHRTAEQAALDLLDRHLVQSTAAKILTERLLMPDYF